MPPDRPSKRPSPRYNLAVLRRLRSLTVLSALLGSITLGPPALAGSPQPQVVPDPPPQTEVVDWVLFDLARAYVDPTRFDPRGMSIAAVEALEAEIPEVLVRHGKDWIEVNVAGSTQRFKLEAKGLWSISPLLSDVMGFVTDNTHLDEQAEADAEYAMIDGLLATLDPHTNLMRPSALSDLTTSTNGEFGGLGIEIGMRDGMVTVLRVLEGNPADAAGMEEGDRIIQIDDESAVEMPVDEVVERLRGERNTYVVVHVRREGSTKPLKFNIKRDTIKLESLSGDVIGGQRSDGTAFPVGVITIPRSFSQTTGREIREQLAKFESEGVQGIVLDMRHNPGGLMQAAVEVSDAFLDSGTIVSMVGAKQPREEDRADGRYDFRDVPIVVLVDQSSASATEIVSGALRNHDRALVMGRRTFGKGSVQVLHPWRIDGDDFALKVTIAQYLTPGDVSIQGVGVSPDLETIPVYIGEKYSSYYGRDRFDRLREESLQSSLTNRRARRVEAPPPVIHYLGRGSIGSSAEDDARLATVKGEAARTRALLRDPEIRLAREFLLWAPSSDRRELVERLPEFLNAQKELEDDAIARSFGKKKVDWSSGPAPAPGKGGKLEATVTIDKSGGRIQAGETGTVTVEVTNKGDAPAYRVRAISDSDYAYFDERELFFGKIEPGKTVKRTLELSVDNHELSRSDQMAFMLHDEHGSEVLGAAPTVDIHGVGHTRPRLAYTAQLLDSDRIKGVVGNGDGALQVGERVRLRVQVRNVGGGTAKEALVQATNRSGEALFLHEGRAKLGEIRPGEEATAELEFELKSAPSDRAADLELLVADIAMGDALEDRLRIPVQENNRTPSAAEAKNAGVKARGSLEIFDAAVGPRHVIATAENGSTFAVEARVGDLYRVTLGKDEYGFVLASAVESTSKPRSAPKVQRVLAVEPPKIELDAPPTMVEGNKVVIRGKASHPSRLRDVYVSVYNPARDLFGAGDKTFYARPKKSDPTSLEFEAEVPLRPGNNLLIIKARHDDRVTESERIWVLSTEGLDEARAAEKAAQHGG